MEVLAVAIATSVMAIPVGYYIGRRYGIDYTPEIEQAWDDGFAVGTNPDLNVGVSEFDMLIDDLNPVRKDPNHFKKSRGF